ncbi:hypothetical protein PAEN110709_25940 [Paenibacillus endophyticus]
MGQIITLFYETVHSINKKDYTQEQIESWANKISLVKIDTDANITARPLFEKRGFKVVKSQIVERNGTKTWNFKMKKSLSNGVKI